MQSPRGGVPPPESWLRAPLLPLSCALAHKVWNVVMGTHIWSPSPSRPTPGQREGVAILQIVARWPLTSGDLVPGPSPPLASST